MGWLGRRGWRRSKAKGLAEGGGHLGKGRHGLSEGGDGEKSGAMYKMGCGEFKIDKRGCRSRYHKRGWG